MGKLDEAERFEPGSLAEWSAWLERHHADRDGVWLVTARRATGRQPFDYEAGVVEALRYGWIDSTQRPVDEDRTMMWFAPRRPGSGWARPNKLRIARLEEEGRLEPAGRAVVEAARANGTWELFDSVEALVVPDDLAEALAAVPGAREHWDGFPPSARKQALAWIAQAKRPETRARRLAETAELAGQGKRAR
jgi:uncharacterized protein YdeI (YjbR/CyaY-like superfamily)